MASSNRINLINSDSSCMFVTSQSNLHKTYASRTLCSHSNLSIFLGWQSFLDEPNTKMAKKRNGRKKKAGKSGYTYTPASPDSRCPVKECIFWTNRNESISKQSCDNGDYEFCPVSNHVWCPPPHQEPTRGPESEQIPWSRDIWDHFEETGEGIHPDLEQ
ncbi:hypothetical protein BU16DRAFT_191487 [Lophium mytilinum]|uniref:Uncharacterized protein n=1 Tax=Lophium mytilinum TaxID=390894 RepID=A0A6A6R963_9PEZI|nr:hypothetical protein BU16DRAFT_191487 [Lophium mytilinum]